MFRSRRVRIASVACAVGLAAVYAESSRTSDALRLTDGSGVLCASVDDAGLATIGHEHLTNVSDGPVDVLRVDLELPGVDLLEWSVLPVEWPGGAVWGDQLAPTEIHHRVGPDQEALLVLVLRTDAANQPPPVAPVLTYEDADGRPGTAELTWQLTMAPPGEACALD